MSKKQKKRNKPYTGADAVSRPTVHHYEAITRSPLSEWWHEHKKQVRLYGIIAGVAAIVIFVVYELFSLVF